MERVELPALTPDETRDFLGRAASSARRRHPKILHAPGDVFNRVINFMMRDSYMQPHLHPGDQKIEHIYLMEGRLAVLFFNDEGALTGITTLERGGVDAIAVPAFTWHTYVMLSDTAITYETMMGQYEPSSWKEMAQWAPEENAPGSAAYLCELKTLAAGAGSRP
ncbi:MAG: WbuC family cupin fold metalloprotein [Acidobacteriota bacterium]|nr:WbuC family cupin fold metalloprotein [Acidobacteriota bacterium]